jgi:tRNA(Ile2)-agmatinylcytidine synthase
VELHIGIDDTDSAKGGCTTYIAARLVERLSNMGIPFLDYPNIIRLNPNIPYKTRGNAAVALRLDIPKEAYDYIQETVLQEIEENSHIGEAGTDPAVVLLKGKPTGKIERLSHRALWDVVPSDEALRVLRHSDAIAAAYGTRLGLVGALAAVGQTLDGDHTFELVAYRRKKNWRTPRRVDENSAKRMEKLTAPRTFNSYDFKNKRMLVTPHGPDPVLLGVRGESPKIVLKEFRMLRILEPVERWVIFRTNHGTDAHLNDAHPNDQVKSNRPAILTGIVASKPERIAGGHVFFKLGRKNGAVSCAAFEPTGAFREVVARLLAGDKVTVYGGAKKHDVDQSVTINLEKMYIHRLVDEVTVENPTCPRCAKHMKSAGKGKGFRCEMCSLVAPDAQKQVIRRQRTLRAGLFVPDKKAHRHLTKPLSRYGMEKARWNHEPPSGKWHEP